MTFVQALLPLIGLVAGGTAVAVVTRHVGRARKSHRLPTDPLCGLFVHDDDTI